MNLVVLLRYIKGFAEIEVCNGFIERFVNLCTRENIHLWDIKYNNNCLITKVSCRDFIKLKKIRKKSGTKIKIIKKYGLAFKSRQYKQRKFLIVSLSGSLVLMMFMNLFVWSIEVTGSERFNKAQVLTIAEKNGLKVGTFAPFFDESIVNREAINDFDGKISWFAVNIKGSKATIEIRDFEKESEETTDNTPCNFIADFDGIIIDADIHSGEQKAFPGVSVNTGTLLISGVSENEDGSINYLQSEGVFTAQHTLTINKTYVKKDKHLILSAKNIFRSLNFFGLNIPLDITSSLSNGERYSYTENLTFGNNVFPLGVKRTSVYDIIESNNCLFRDKIYLLINIDKYTSDEYYELKNSKIINADYKIKADNNEYFIEGIYDCIDFIGKKAAIITED